VRPIAILSIAASLGAGVALAGEKSIALKSAPGLDKVEAGCSSCHSLDYLVMNSPFLPVDQWEAEVTKMVKVMGAPISDADARIIADYLKQNYAAPANGAK